MLRLFWTPRFARTRAMRSWSLPERGRSGCEIGGRLDHPRVAAGAQVRPLGRPGQKLPPHDPPGDWSVICLTTTSHYLTTGAPPASHGPNSLLRTTFGSLRDRARRSRAPHAAGAGALRPDDRARRPGDLRGRDP